jgi:hypothetical protein
VNNLEIRSRTDVANYDNGWDSLDALTIHFSMHNALDLTDLRA